MQFFIILTIRAQIVQETGCKYLICLSNN